MTDLLETDPLPECVATVTATMDAYNQILDSGSVLFIHEVAQKKKKSFLKSKGPCPRVLEFRKPSGNIVRLTDTCAAGFSTKAADIKLPIHQICNGVRQLPVEIQCFALPQERKLDATKTFMLLEVCDKAAVVVGISRNIYEAVPAMTLPLDFPLTLVPVRARDPVRNKQIQANLEETVHSEKFQRAHFGVVTSDISVNSHIQQAFYESVPTTKFEIPSVARAYEIPTPWKLQVGDLKEDPEEDLNRDPHYDYVDVTKPRTIIIPGSKSKEMTIFTAATSTNKSSTKRTSGQTEEAYVDTTIEAGETESERSEDDTTSKSLQLASEEPSSKDCLQQDKGTEIDPYIQMVKGNKRTPKSPPPSYSAAKSKPNSTDMKDRANTRVTTSTPTVKARNQPKSPVTTSTDTSKPTPPSTTLKTTPWGPTLKSPPSDPPLRTPPSDKTLPPPFSDPTLTPPSSDETPTPCPPIRRVKQTLATTKQHNPPVKATKPTIEPSSPATSSKPSIPDPGQQGTTSRDIRTAIDTPKAAVKAGAPILESKPPVAPRERTSTTTSRQSLQDTTSEQAVIDTPKPTESASTSTPPVTPRETSTANGKPSPPVAPTEQNATDTSGSCPPDITTLRNLKPKPLATSSRTSKEDTSQKGKISKDTSKQTNEGSVSTPPVVPREKTSTTTNKRRSQETTTEEINIETPKATDGTSSLSFKPSPPVALREQNTAATSKSNHRDTTNTLQILKPSPPATSSKPSITDPGQRSTTSRDTRTAIDTPKAAVKAGAPTFESKPPVVPRERTSTTTSRLSLQDTTSEQADIDTPKPTEKASVSTPPVAPRGTSTVSGKPSPPITPTEQNATETSKSCPPDITTLRSLKPSPPATSSKPSIPDPGQQGTTTRDTRTAIDTPKAAVKAGAPTIEPKPPVAPRERTSTTTSRLSLQDTTSEQADIDTPKPTEKASVSTPPVAPRETSTVSGKPSPPITPTEQNATDTSKSCPPDITTLQSLKPSPPATSSKTSIPDPGQQGTTRDTRTAIETQKAAVKAGASTLKTTPLVAPRGRTSTITDKTSLQDTRCEKTDVDTPKPTEKASVSTPPVTPRETSTANGKPSHQDTTREQSSTVTSRGSPTDTTSKRAFKPSTPTKGVRAISSIFESSLQGITQEHTQTDTDETNRGDSTSTPTSPPITPNQPTMPATKSTSSPKPQSITAIKSSSSKIELDSDSEPSDEDQYVDVNVNYVEPIVSTPSSKMGTSRSKVAPETATPTDNTDHIYEDDGIYSEVQYGESEELFYQFPENPPELPMRGQQFPHSSGLSTSEKSTRFKNMKLLGQIKSITSDAVKSFKKEMQAEKQQFLDAINAKQDRPQPPPSTDQSPAVPVMQRTARPSTVTVGKKSSHPKQVAAITYTVPIHVKKKTATVPSRCTASAKRGEPQREPSSTDPTVKKQPPPRPPPAMEVVNKRALNGLDNEGVLALLKAMNLTEFQPSFKQVKTMSSCVTMSNLL